MKTIKGRNIVIALFFLLSSIFILACQREQEQMIGDEVGVEEAEEVRLEEEELEQSELGQYEPERPESENTFQQISATEAKEIMEGNESFILLDVREQEEFEEGHIEGAVLMPVNQITELAPDIIPDKGTLILVYCRSGRRSVEASQQLVDLGYTRVVEFGGIIDWPYEIVR